MPLYNLADDASVIPLRIAKEGEEGEEEEQE